MLSPILLALLCVAHPSDTPAPFRDRGTQDCSEASAGPRAPDSRSAGVRISAAPAFDPSGAYCALPLEDGSVEWVELETGAVTRLPRAGEGKVEGLAFDVHGRRLAVWNWTRGVTLRALPGGEVVVRLPDRTLDLWWQRLVFSHDGSRLLTWGGSRSAYLWDAATGELVARLEHERQVVEHAAWTPAGERIVTCGEDGVRAWGARTGNPLESALSVAPPARHFAFDPTGTRVALACGDARVLVLDARSGMELARIAFPRWGIDWEDEARSVAFDASGERLLTSSRSGETQLWSLKGDAPARAWERSCLGGGPHEGRFEKGGAWVALSGLERCLGRSELVETATGRTLLRSGLPAGRWLGASPDGRWIVDASPGELRVYDGARLEPSLHSR